MDVVLVSWYDGEVFMWKQEVKWLMWVELDYELRMWGLRIIVNWIEVLYDWMCLQIGDYWRWVFWLSNWVDSEWSEWIDLNWYWNEVIEKEQNVMVKDGVESLMWISVYVWENWLLEDIDCLISVYWMYGMLVKWEVCGL